MRKLEFSESEFQALAGMLDAVTKALGIRALKDGAALLAKLEASTELPDAVVESAAE